jgi:hypothetical protein
MQKILLLLMLPLCGLLASTAAYADLSALACSDAKYNPRPCKDYVSGKTETKRQAVKSVDYSWTCDAVGIIRIDLYNSTTHNIQKVVIEGAKTKSSLTHNVFLPPKQSEYILIMTTGAFCRNEKSARLYIEFEHYVQGYCSVQYTGIEISKRRKECEKEKAELLKRQEANAVRQREIEQLRQQESLRNKEIELIYNNCVISKSRGIGNSALDNVRSLCESISNDPSMLQKLKWGNWEILLPK